MHLREVAEDLQLALGVELILVQPLVDLPEDARRPQDLQEAALSLERCIVGFALDEGRAPQEHLPKPELIVQLLEGLHACLPHHTVDIVGVWLLSGWRELAKLEHSVRSDGGELQPYVQPFDGCYLVRRLLVIVDRLAVPQEDEVASAVAVHQVVVVILVRVEPARRSTCCVKLGYEHGVYRVDAMHFGITREFLHVLQAEDLLLQRAPCVYELYRPTTVRDCECSRSNLDQLRRLRCVI